MSKWNLASVASAVAKRLWRDEPLVRDRQVIIPRLRLAIGEKSRTKFCGLSHRPSSIRLISEQTMQNLLPLLAWKLARADHLATP